MHIPRLPGDPVPNLKLARPFDALPPTDLGAVESRALRRRPKTKALLERSMMCALMQWVRAASCSFVAQRGFSYGVPHGCVEDVVQCVQLSFTRRLNLDDVPRDVPRVFRSIYQRSLTYGMIDFARKYGQPRAPKDGAAVPSTKNAYGPHESFDEALALAPALQLPSPEVLAGWIQLLERNLDKAPVVMRAVWPDPRHDTKPETSTERSRRYRNYELAKQHAILEDESLRATL